MWFCRFLTLLLVVAAFCVVNCEDRQIVDDVATVHEISTSDLAKARPLSSMQRDLLLGMTARRNPGQEEDENLNTFDVFKRSTNSGVGIKFPEKYNGFDSANPQNDPISSSTASFFMNRLKKDYIHRLTDCFLRNKHRRPADLFRLHTILPSIIEYCRNYKQIGWQNAEDVITDKKSGQRNKSGFDIKFFSKDKDFVSQIASSKTSVSHASEKLNFEILRCIAENKNLINNLPFKFEPSKNGDIKYFLYGEILAILFDFPEKKYSCVTFVPLNWDKSINNILQLSDKQVQQISCSIQRVADRILLGTPALVNLSSSSADYFSWNLLVKDSADRALGHWSQADFVDFSKLEIPAEIRQGLSWAKDEQEVKKIMQANLEYTHLPAKAKELMTKFTELYKENEKLIDETTDIAIMKQQKLGSGQEVIKYNQNLRNQLLDKRKRVFEHQILPQVDKIIADVSGNQEFSDGSRAKDPIVEVNKPVVGIPEADDGNVGGEADQKAREAPLKPDSSKQNDASAQAVNPRSARVVEKIDELVSSGNLNEEEKRPARELAEKLARSEKKNKLPKQVFEEFSKEQYRKDGILILRPDLAESVEKVAENPSEYRNLSFVQMVKLKMLAKEENDKVKEIIEQGQKMLKSRKWTDLLGDVFILAKNELAGYLNLPLIRWITARFVGYLAKADEEASIVDVKKMQIN